MTNSNVHTDASKFTPITLDIIRPNCPFDFDLYVKVNEKFILYIPKGEGINDDQHSKIEQILKLKEKNVDRLFITSEGEQAFENMVDADIDEAVNNEELPVDDKMKIIEEIAATSIEVVYTDPESPMAYKLTEKSAQGLRKVVQDNPKALKKIYAKKGRDTEVVQTHSKNVASLSLRLAFSLGFRNEDLDNLGAAALLHDVGLKNLSQDEIDILFKRPPKMMGGDDKRIYQCHSKDSADIVRKNPKFNDEIATLVENHEEKLQGQGYPAKLQKLEPLQQILNLVNHFDKRVSCYGMKPVEAFKDLQLNETGNFDLSLLKKLKEVCEAEGIFDQGSIVFEA